MNRLLQLAGGACVVVGAALIVTWLAWVVAGIGLIALAVMRDLTEESDGTNDDRSVP